MYLSMPVLRTTNFKYDQSRSQVSFFFTCGFIYNVPHINMQMYIVNFTKSVG